MRRLHLVTPLITPLLLGAVMAVPAPTAAHAQIVGVGLSITIAPPMLPVYVQPAIPAPGYMWTPGYWAYGSDGYYWVPGTWVEPPQVGLLWTPGYWGFVNGVYAWNAGYWGPQVGFYGGVNYGFGYTGDGYYGGRWDHGAFAYNRSVNNFGSVHITNVYNSTVVNNNNRVAFNGGTGGLTARPTAQQEAFAHEHHVAPTSAQVQQERTASNDPRLHYTANHGQPPIAATSRPGEFSGRGVVAAGEAHPNGAAERPAGAPGEARPGTEASHEATPGARTPGTEAHPGVATQATPGARPGTAEAPRGAATNEARPGVGTEAPRGSATNEARPGVATEAPRGSATNEARPGVATPRSGGAAWGRDERGSTGCRHGGAAWDCDQRGSTGRRHAASGSDHTASGDGGDTPDCRSTPPGHTPDGRGTASGGAGATPDGSGSA